MLNIQEGINIMKLIIHLLTQLNEHYFTLALLIPIVVSIVQRKKRKPMTKLYFRLWAHLFFALASIAFWMWWYVGREWGPAVFIWGLASWYSNEWSKG